MGMAAKDEIVLGIVLAYIHRIMIDNDDRKLIIMILLNILDLRADSICIKTADRDRIDPSEDRKTVIYNNEF